MVHFLVNSYGVSVSQMTNDIFCCRNYNPIISSFIAYPSGASEFIPFLVRFELFDL